MLKVRILIAAFLLLVLYPLLAYPRSVQASVFGSLINNVKNFLHPENNSLRMESKIALARGGDLKKNDQIDAGDIVTFSYTITNATKNSYKAVTLKTNVNTKEVSGVTNVQGTLNLDTSKDTISIPYLTLNPGQVLTISFDAQVNFYIDADHPISTEAELVDESNASLVKAEKKEVTAKKMEMERFNKVTHTTE